jgi:hypothetical protein
MGDYEVTIPEMLIDERGVWRGPMDEGNPLTCGCMKIVGEREDGCLVWAITAKALPFCSDFRRALAAMGFLPGVHRLRDGVMATGWVKTDPAP